MKTNVVFSIGIMLLTGTSHADTMAVAISLFRTHLLAVALAR
jgi:hypothetical protein